MVDQLKPAWAPSLGSVTVLIGCRVYLSDQGMQFRLMMQTIGGCTETLVQLNARLKIERIFVLL